MNLIILRNIFVILIVVNSQIIQMNKIFFLEILLNVFLINPYKTDHDQINWTMYKTKNNAKINHIIIHQIKQKFIILTLANSIAPKLLPLNATAQTNMIDQSG